MYICSTLSAPDANGLQVCISWVEQSPIIPPMTYAQASAIGGAFFALLASVWVINVIKDHIRRS